MTAFEPYTIKCYRVSYGDVGVPDGFHPGALPDEAKEVARRRLLSFFENERIRSGEKPHTADLIDGQDNIVAIFQVRATTSGTQKIVELPSTHRSKKFILPR